jgi:hypothetical protein
MLQLLHQKTYNDRQRVDITYTSPSSQQNQKMPVNLKG